MTQWDVAQCFYWYEFVAIAMNYKTSTGKLAIKCIDYKTLCG